MNKELKKVAKAVIFNENPKKTIKETIGKNLLGKFNYKRIEYTAKIIKQLKKMWY